MVLIDVKSYHDSTRPVRIDKAVDEKKIDSNRSET